MLAALAHHHRPGRALDFFAAGLITSSTPFLGCIPKLQSQLFSTRRRASYRRLLACCHLVRQGLMRTTIWLQRFHRCPCQRLRGLLHWMRVYLCGHISWASPHQGLASSAPQPLIYNLTKLFGRHCHQETQCASQRRCIGTIRQSAAAVRRSHSEGSWSSRQNRECEYSRARYRVAVLSWRRIASRAIASALQV